MRKSEKGRLYRAAAAGMTAAMIMTMGGMSAFAADASDNIGSLNVTKKVTASSSNIYAPNASFSFKVEPVTVAAGTTDGNKQVVYSGVAGGVTFANGTDTVTFDPTEKLTADGEGGSISKSIALSLNNKTDFGKPGIYRYQVTETKPDSKYDGMTYDETKYYVDLYVEYDDADTTHKTYVVVGVVVSKEVTDDEGSTSIEKVTDDSSKGMTFTNDYTTNSLTVTKRITGNQANLDGTFAFTITIAGQTGENFTVVKPDGTTEKAVNGESVNVSLGKDQTVTIDGLSPADTFTVVENDANTDGYKTTYKLDEKAAAADDLKKVTEGSTGHAVEVTNDKTVTTPTGIVLSYAPYVLLVGAAGGFGALFFRKKREEF